jgi:hypothetical protein
MRCGLCAEPDAGFFDLIAYSSLPIYCFAHLRYSICLCFCLCYFAPYPAQAN